MKMAAKRTVCKRGHSLTGDNVYINPTNGCRSCYTCKLNYLKQWRVQNRSYIKKYNKTYKTTHKIKLNAQRMQNYYNNIDKERTQHREWCEKNKQHVKKYSKKYYDKNTDALRLKTREYYKINKKEIIARTTERFYKNYHSNIQLKLRVTLRTRLGAALRKIDRKAGSAVKDLGCSIGEFKLYIENYFPLYPGMSWANYGPAWHLDHFLPLAHFDLTEREQFLEAFHYTNIQPLWAQDNLKKNRRMPAI